jgi:WD40 repeat protein
MRYFLTIVISCIVLLASGQTTELKVNVGHSKGVMDVAYSPDGKYLITASKDATLKLWSVAIGKELRTYTGHTKVVCSVCFSPDGTFFASGSWDGTIQLWNLENDKSIKTFNPKANSVNSVSISPDSKLLAGGTSIGTITIWDIESGNEIVVLVGHTNNIETINFSPDSKFLVSGSDDKNIKIWDVSTGKIVRTLSGHSHNVSSVSFSPNGNSILSGSYDGSIKIWDRNTGKLTRTIPGTSKWIMSVRYSPDGKLLVSASSDTIVRLWNASTGVKVRNYGGHKYAIYSAKFSPDGNNIVSASDDGSMRIWSASNSNVVQSFKMLGAHISSVNLSPDKKNLQFVYNYKSIKVLSLLESKGLCVLNGHKSMIEAVAFTPNSETIASGSYDQTIKLWDVRRCNELKLLKGHNNIIRSLSFSNDGKYLLSGSGGLAGGDNSIKLWDIGSGELVKSFNSHTSSVYTANFSPDGKFFVSGCLDQSIKIWDISTGEELKTLKGHPNPLSLVKFSADGKKIISHDNHGVTKLWDVSSGTELKTNKNNIEVESCSLSPNDNFLASSSGYFSKIDVFNINNWYHHTTLTYDNKVDVSSVSFSPDSKFLLSGSSDACITLWDLKKEKKVAKIFFIGETDWVAVTPDGRFEGTKNGINEIYFVNNLEVIPLESLFEKLYSPGLLIRLLGGEILETPDIDVSNIASAPKIRITSPNNNDKIVTPEVTIATIAKDLGGGIDEICLYHNDKLVETTGRGLKKVNAENEVQKSYSITLVSGENSIKVKAFNNQRTESIPHEIKIYYEGTKTQINLYMLVIGLNEYKNPKYKLNYAVADAMAFKETVETNSRSIFGNIEVTYLQNDNVTKERIVNEFTRISSKAKPQDVFIFYYAGHGVMSEETKAQFYIIPFDITQLYGDNSQLVEKAISASELQNLSRAIVAQKQLFILDACQSGGMIEQLATRGTGEEKAIAQLARSTGTYWLAASSSQQFATEFAQLGHGLFTYTILEGLKGGAKTSASDGRISVESLSTFIKNMLPVLSEKYKGEAQYPSSYGYGNDFPIILLK